jgi:hypothetical protein
VRGELSVKKIPEILQFWEKEFILEGRERDLARTGPSGRRLLSDMFSISLVFKQPPDATSVYLNMFFEDLLTSPHLDEAKMRQEAKEWAAGLLDPSKSQVWQMFAGDAIVAIDGILEFAEGV